MFRCKFKVVEVAKYESGRKLKLTATSDNSGDNEDWSKYTPSGTFEIFVTNEVAFPRIDSLKAGELFYIDLNLVDSMERNFCGDCGEPVIDCACEGGE